MRRLVLLMVLAGFASCGGGRAHREPVRLPMRTVRDVYPGLSLDFPVGWAINRFQQNAPLLLEARSPAEARGDFLENVNLVVLSFPEPTSASEVRQANLREIAGRYPEYELEATGSLNTADRVARWATIKVTVDGFPLKDKIYYFVQNKEGFVLTCTAEPAAFERYEILFDRIAASFKKNTVYDS